VFYAQVRTVLGLALDYTTVAVAGFLAKETTWVSWTVFFVAGLVALADIENRHL
jgi:hypothetical protein